MVGTGTLKIAEQIKLIAAETLARRVNDPRLGFVTITEVRLRSDWQLAQIFYTVLGDEAARASTAEALEALKGQVRTAVAKGLKTRSTPVIEFHLDQLPESSEQFDELLASVRASDAEIAAKAAGAPFAGDENPYREGEDTGS